MAACLTVGREQIIRSFRMMIENCTGYQVSDIFEPHEKVVCRYKYRD